MFIHGCYALEAQHLSTKEYKQEVAKLTSLGMRRANRFNLLAVYGALQCALRHPLLRETHVYLATEYGPVGSLMNVLEQMQKGHLAPFDFLGLNTNASFYVAKALQLHGRHAMLTAHDVSLEKAVHLAYVDFQEEEIEAALIGRVDEVLADVPRLEQCITNVSEGYVDQSLWLYATKEPKGAMAEVVMVKESHLQDLLKEGCFGYEQVNLASFAAQNKKLLEGLKMAGKTVTAVSLAEALAAKTAAKTFLHVSQDSLGKMVLIGIRYH